MNKFAKKFLVSGLAIALFGSVGAGVANTNVNASSRTQIVKLEHQRKYYSQKLSNINRQLSRLTRKNKRTHKSHKESLALWYYHNGKRLYTRNINKSRLFRKGYMDAIQSNLNMDHVNNKQYHLGWIVGASSDGSEVNTTNLNHSKNSYKIALRQFNQAKSFAKSNGKEIASYNNEANDWE